MNTSSSLTTRSGLRLQVEILVTASDVRVVFQAGPERNCRLHWGLRRRDEEAWALPPEALWPAGSQRSGAALQTPLSSPQGSLQVKIQLPVASGFSSVEFVLYFPEENRWDNNGGRNYSVSLVNSGPEGVGSVRNGAALVTRLAEEIIRGERHNSWTLMHRFNLCHDLLDQARQDVDALAWFFVWLRFSAIRQLTWQRNYNTKPRELAHAQDRLTQKLAQMFQSESTNRPWVRLMLTTVGPGGEGQRIRDEILNIMHRRHIKEVSGHFLEEWHQKLHNNTTPDDVVICEAFLEFLRTNGNQERFAQILQEGGVTRARLESFERPIRSRPDFVPHLKEGLLHDFQNFLGILKAAHAATDFDSARGAARGRLPRDLEGLVDWISGHRHDGGENLPGLVRQITEGRRRLAEGWQHAQATREALYLDLALEQLLRGAIERNLHLRPGGDLLAELIASVLENLALSHENPELRICATHWRKLLAIPRFGREWSLQAKSVADRIARGLGASIDQYYQLLQPKAEFLGRELQVEEWAISLFSEGVVRGSSLGFVLSMLLHQLDPLLRQTAQLGAWQIISRGQGFGRIEVVDSLRAYVPGSGAGQVIVVADHVLGDEEIPEGVTAVIAPDVTDIVSHVAVRARNANVLFASCHDPELLRELKSLRGQFRQLDIDSRGDITVSSLQSPVSGSQFSAPLPRLRRPARPKPVFSGYAVSMDEFDERVVGGKSCHLARLRGRLPSCISLPASAAIPFGVFEKVLGLPANQDAARRYRELIRDLSGNSSESLAALREIVLTLGAPEELPRAFQNATTQAGLPWAGDWDQAWNRIKRVWASKWNDRAVLNRAKMGFAHEDFFMAVLVQQVIPADYAFVIHTVNPSTGNSGELFAEVVLGLGETLVGNHPGRALSFSWAKATGRLNLLSFPSKSFALYGEGLIFRSDSNGEDIEGYAGAGLYDSVLLHEPRSALTDYSQEPLICEVSFRSRLLTSIAQVGLEIESALGSPQDIEGVVTKGACVVVQTRPQVGIDPPRKA